MRFCPECGAQNRDTAKFCESCGEALSVAGATPAGPAGADGVADLDSDKTVVGAAAPQMTLGGRYEIIEELGRGAMGVVYLANDTTLDMQVALKVLPPSLSSDDAAVARLKNEARAAMRLLHHNILRVINFEETPEACFLTMEYLEGFTVEDWAQDYCNGALSIEDFLSFVGPICDALQYAHEQGVVHGDLKPSNIMLTSNERGLVKVVDFGIARIMREAAEEDTASGTIEGTMKYMAPELMQGHRGAPLSDQYALACTFYELLAGEPVFATGDQTFQHLNKPPKPIDDVPDHINAALLRALAKSPADRFPDIRAFRDALLSGGTAPVAATPEPAALAVGIDFGSAWSVVGMFREGSLSLAADEDHGPRVPSLVAEGHSPIVAGYMVGGFAAQEMESGAVIPSLKRLLGRPFAEAEAEADHYDWALTEHNGLCTCRAGGAFFAGSPPKLLATLFRSLKERLEAATGATVDEVVMTVPIHFDDVQRQSLRDAAEIAGMKIKRLLSGAVAGGLAYARQNLWSGTMAVVDIGAGYCDVAILSADTDLDEDGDPDSCTVQTLAIAGDRVGGDDVERAIGEVLSGALKQLKGKEVKFGRETLRSVKEALADRDEVQIRMRSPDGNGEGDVLKLTRANMETAIAPELKRIAETCRDARISSESITPQCVLLLGGTCRMPIVQKTIQEAFGLPVDTSLLENEPESAAIGATIQAAVARQLLSDTLLIDALPHTLGIETLGGVSTPLLKRNTSLPARTSEVFSTAADNQKSVELHILQGEASMAADNRSLGSYTLSGIPEAPKGVPQIEVTFSVDADGRLEVYSKDLATGTDLSVRVEVASDLTRDEVEKASSGKLDEQDFSSLFGSVFGSKE